MKKGELAKGCGFSTETTRDYVEEKRSVAITLDTYSHVLPGLQDAAALRFEEGLHATRDSAKIPPPESVPR